MEESIKVIASISAALTGAIIGWMAVLRPLLEALKARRAQRQKATEEALRVDKEYRQEVLSRLESLGTRIESMDSSIAELQRDNIERAYCMFKMEHGYCTSGMKEATADMYESYRARGFNHIAESRIKELMALPEYPTK